LELLSVEENGLEGYAEEESFWPTRDSSS